MSTLPGQSQKNLNWREVRNSARGRWHSILRMLGLPEHYLSNRHGPCPVCGGKDRFRWDDKNGSGSYFCNRCCGSGDGFRLVQKLCNCSPIESLLLVAKHLSIGSGSRLGHVNTIIPCGFEAVEQSTYKRYRTSTESKLKRVWNESVLIDSGDPVHTYLTKTRKLSLHSIPNSLRFHPALPYFDEDQKCIGKFPAMMAAIVNSEGQLVSIHRTYLTADGLKASVSHPKKLMQAINEGATRGAAIKLYEPNDVLGVAEGIETALACRIATDIPTWATSCAGGMEALIIPNAVQEIVIFADNDRSGKGTSAARILALRALEEDRRVKILLPDEVGTDWADVVAGLAK